MSSKIEQLIDEIEEYIDNCKPQAFSSTKIIVNKEQIDELLRELRMKTPDEIKRYQKIISNKEAILSDARNKAEDLVKQATIQTNQLINEHEIMQQAYAQANEVVTMATRQAQEILDNATMEANAVRMSAIQYMDDMLADLDNILDESTQKITNNYEHLIQNLNHYHGIVRSNRAELHPSEEDFVEMEEEAEKPIESIDVI